MCTNPEPRELCTVIANFTPDALGPFYFHLMTAYSILRSEKVELGKADYVAHLFPHIRPETMLKG